MAEWGLDVPTAVNLFLTQVADKKKFQISLPPRVRKVPNFGCLKGKIWMADNFDAPMEEFKDHM